MIRKSVGLLICFSTLFFLVTSCGAAEVVSSADLIVKAKDLDGKIVEYEGEVVGDIMVRGGFAWLNLNDGKNAIGVWADRRAIGGITSTGGYKSKGDVVRVNGIFNRARSEHGGDPDIHAQTINKIVSGTKVIHPLDKRKMDLAILLTGLLVLTVLIGNRRYKPDK